MENCEGWSVLEPTAMRVRSCPPGGSTFGEILLQICCRWRALKQPAQPFIAIAAGGVRCAPRRLRTNATPKVAVQRRHGCQNGRLREEHDGARNQSLRNRPRQERSQLCPADADRFPGAQRGRLP